jgi:hypothetical protein
MGITGSMQLRAMEDDDVETVSSFLLRINRRCVSPNFTAEALRWKYLQPRPEWEGSRAFVLRKAGVPVAFGGILPTILRLPDGKGLNSATLIDWAGDHSTPGAGIIVMNNVSQMAGPIFIISGSDDALRVLPNIGFRRLPSITAYSRWVRPYLEFAKRPKKARSFLRVAHGTYCALRFRPREHSEWEAKPVTQFDEVVIPFLNREPATSACVPLRQIDTLNYVLRCPIVKTTGFLLQRKGFTAGYFLSATVGWECRLLDISIDSDEQSDWNSACSVAVSTIAREPEVGRIFAWAFAPRLRAALIVNGFWLQSRKSLMLRDPARSLSQEPQINLQMLDGEAAFLV